MAALPMAALPIFKDNEATDKDFHFYFPSFIGIHKRMLLFESYIEVQQMRIKDKLELNAFADIKEDTRILNMLISRLDKIKKVYVFNELHNKGKITEDDLNWTHNDIPIYF